MRPDWLVLAVPGWLAGAAFVALIWHIGLVGIPQVIMLQVLTAWCFLLWGIVVPLSAWRCR